MPRLKFEIVPLKGVGPILFRMPRKEVRNLLQSLGAPFEAFQKSEELKYKADAFDSLGIHVYYGGKTPIVNFVEVFSGAGALFLYRGKSVFSMGIGELLETFSFDAKCVDNEEQYCSFTFPKLEIGVWRPYRGVKHWESIGVGAKGYYSRLARYKRT